jgi:hypothetical protein
LRSESPAGVPLAVGALSEEEVCVVVPPAPSADEDDERSPQPRAVRATASGASAATILLCIDGRPEMGTDMRAGG